MPDKNPNTRRFGGPGSSQQDRKHPDKPTGAKASNSDVRAAHHSKVSGGGGENDYHHTHAAQLKGGRGG